jgi:hypothetical protein
MKTKIINDFVPDYYNNLINESIFGDVGLDFPWYYLSNISGAHDTDVKDVKFNKNQAGFFHIVYTENSAPSPMFNMLLPFLETAKAKFEVPINRLLRIRIGMNLNTGEQASHHPHTDLDIPNKTLLYYIDESDGDTIFYKYDDDDNLVIDNKNPHTRNQAVLFDGLTMHSSSSPIEYAKRTTININFI